MDELVKNAPFGTDFTPQPQWRLGKRPGDWKSMKKTQIYARDDDDDEDDNHPPRTSYAHRLTKKIESIDFFQQPSFYAKSINKAESSEEDLVEANKSNGEAPDNYDLDVAETAYEKNLENSFSLETLVNSRLQKQPIKKIKLKDIYKDLLWYDREKSGLISENQLNLIAIKHELPLKVSTLRMLCHKFADGDYPHLIHYDKLLKFLAGCVPIPKSHEADDPNSVRVGSTKFALDDIMRSYPVYEKLIVMLKDQMTGAECWNLERLYEALHKADRYDERQLKSDVIMNICLEQQIPLTKSLLVRLLQKAEVDHGNVNWREFLAPIVRACTEVYPDNRVDASSSRSRWNKNDVHKISPDPSADAMRRNPIAPSFPGPIEKYADFVSSMKRGATWSHNFAQLSCALKTFNPYKTDRLPKPEVERMLRNYNVIYDLGFSTGFMDDAIKRSVVDEDVVDYEVTQIVSIDLLLRILAAKPVNESLSLPN